MAQYYAQRASAGLIISEAIGISQQGLGWPFATGLWSDEGCGLATSRAVLCARTKFPRCLTILAALREMHCAQDSMGSGARRQRISDRRVLARRHQFRYEDRRAKSPVHRRLA
ncbi:hypothetical protein [Caballeronia sp. AZ7_KS35]|uniref:hypothetical protein n=1 Tax=Caballeronia sp. AZ7_KS35 TaxID=2921762 RepID=UPI00202981EC|nr:hypothetical protein [Caballeronia sp. AZ7_KS35]